MTTIIDKLNILEKEASFLNTSSEDWKKLATITTEYCKKMLSNIDDAKAFNSFSPNQVIENAEKHLSIFPEHTIVANNQADSSSSETRFTEILIGIWVVSLHVIYQ